MMSGNHETLEGGGEEAVLVEYVLVEEVEEEGGNDITMEEELPVEEELGRDGEEEVDESQSNQEVLIFKSEGMSADTVITYSIPISSPGEYDEAVEDSESAEPLIKDDHSVLQHPYLTYQIIDGYLVPTNSTIAHSQKPTSTAPTPQNDVILRPIKPGGLTPEALRRKSRLEPKKLLIVYHCSFCDAAFEDFQSIKLHESEHIGAGDSVLINENPQTNYLGTKLMPTATEAKFYCPYCFLACTMSAELRAHVRKSHKKETLGRKPRPRPRAAPKKVKSEFPTEVPVLANENHGSETVADALEGDEEDYSGDEHREFMLVHHESGVDGDDDGDGEPSFTYEAIDPLRR